MGDSFNYYGYDGNESYGGTNCYDYISSFNNTPTLISLEQWHKCISSKFPEKWCLNCVILSDKEKDFLKKNVDTVNQFSNTKSFFYHFRGTRSVDSGDQIVKNGYTLVTFEEFKAYISEEDTFTFPETWCIQGCEELMEWQKKDRNNNCNCSFGHFDCFYFNRSATLSDKSWDWEKDEPSRPLITFKQFKTYILKEENKFVFPKKWHLVVTEENQEVLSEWRFGESYPTLKLAIGKIVGLYGGSSKEHDSIRSEGFGEEITFEQFKEHVLKNNKSMKQIKGYRLVKPEYEKAAIQLMQANWGDNNYNITDPSCIESLRNAGVLDLWCEPIYEEVPKVFDLLNCVIIISLEKQEVCIDKLQLSLPGFKEQVFTLFTALHKGIAGHSMQIADTAEIKFGCTTFTYEEMCMVKDYLKTL